MRESPILNSISFKLGLLFSGVFLTLLLILGLVLYGVFTNLFVDFVTKDLIVRGNNHAKALEKEYNIDMIDHIISMEKGGSSLAVITDKNQNIISFSTPPDQEMKKDLLKKSNKQLNFIVNKNWKNDKYISTASSIGKDKGFIYMFYPSKILRDTVFVFKLLIVITSVGTILLGIGLIGFLSRRITKPLLIMKEATNRMAMGRYSQKIPSKGNDEIALLSNAIQQLGEQLQFYEDSRNEFLSAVSHELRTPLTYIKGYSDVLVKGMITNKNEQTEYLTIINKEAKRVAFLVDDLVEMSKLQMGQFKLEKEPADLNHIINRVTATLRPAAENKGIELVLSLSDHLPSIFMDEKRIEQVVYNLIENAIKYTENGEVFVSTHLKKDSVTIEIKDTGIGIPQHELSKIWDRFYRVEKSRARKTGGTGLGLFIAKQIIDSHEGKIGVESIENKGSTFSVSLPKGNDPLR